MSLPTDILNILALTTTKFSCVSKDWNFFWLSKTLFLDNLSDLNIVGDEIKILNISKIIVGQGLNTDILSKLKIIIERIKYLKISPKLFILIRASLKNLKVLSFHGDFIDNLHIGPVLNSNTLVRQFKVRIRRCVPKFVIRLTDESEKKLLKQFVSHWVSNDFCAESLDDCMIFKRKIETNKITYHTGFYDHVFNLANIEHIELDIESREYNILRIIKQFTNIKSIKYSKDKD